MQQAIVMAIAAGNNNGMALRSNGTVVVWGSNAYGLTNVPAGLANVVGIAAGNYHCLALRADGRVAAWGYNPLGQTNVPPGLSNVIAVWATGNSSLALRRDGTVAVWGGWPTNGITALSNLVSLAACEPKGLALQAGGTVTYFGTGQVFSGLITNLANLSNVIGVAVGGIDAGFCVALLGDGSPAVTLQPATQTATPGANLALHCRVAGVQPISYQWQLNGVNVPGAANATLNLTNVQARDAGGYRVLLANARGISVSASATVSLSQIYVWNLSPAKGNYAQPTNVPAGLIDLTGLALGDAHILGLRANGTVVSWSNPTNALATNQPAGLNNVSGIAVVGSTQNLVLKATGTVMAWGTSSSLTNLPLGLSNVVAIAASHNVALALQTDGTVRSWNPYAFSAFNSTPPLSNIAAVAAGDLQSLALDRNGRVTAWTNNSIVPASVPAGLSNVIAIAAGYSHYLALRADGTVASWGSITNALNSLTNVVAIAAGYNLSLALRADGSISVQGSDAILPAQIPLVVPAQIANVVAIGLGGTSYAQFAAVLTGSGSPALTLQPADQPAKPGDTVRLHARAAGAQPIRYQWQRNGVDLPGATNASLTLTNVQAKDAGGYRLVAANALGAQTSRNAAVTVPVGLAEALNAPGLTWAGGGAAPWFGQAAQSHDGMAAAQSGPITNNQQSVLQTSLEGPGTLSFWWKVSSEEDFDFLNFYVDGVPATSGISGEIDWRQVTVSLGAGAHTLQWIYAKDPSVSDGLDAGWVDEVTFAPAPPTLLASPQSQTVGAGTTVLLAVAGQGQTACQWLKEGGELPGATNARLVLTNVGRRDAGVYAARLANAGGSALSSNAVLIVRVPQRLGAPAGLPDGSFVFASRDADGGSLRASDLAGFEAQTSSNLIHWETLSNALTVTNGALWLRDFPAAGRPSRFYRLVEHQP